jgi:hypothetical protein
LFLRDTDDSKTFSGGSKNRERKPQSSWIRKQVKMGKGSGKRRRGDAETRRRDTTKSRARSESSSEVSGDAGSKNPAILRFSVSSIPTPRFPTAASIAVGFMTLALMTSGCSNSLRKPQGDPLFGNVKPQPGLNAADATNPVPPLPGPTSTGSTAALASVNPRPIDGTHDLRIPDSTLAGNANPAWNGAGSIGTAPPITVPTSPVANGMASPVALAPGGQLQQPTTGFAPVSRMQSGTTPGADATRLAGGNLTYEGAQAQLTARGVTWQRLESWGDQGDWKFTCSIPNKQNPYISRTYEAEAHDPLSAVRGVLDQLDHDQR